MRRALLVVVLLGCGDEGDGDSDPTCPGCADACGPVEGGAPCCVAPDPDALDCIGSQRLDVQTHPESEGGGVSLAACRHVAPDGTPIRADGIKGPFVSYHPDGSPVSYGDPVTRGALVTYCDEVSGRVAWRVRNIEPSEQGPRACIVECYDANGAPLTPCPHESLNNPPCET